MTEIAFLCVLPIHHDSHTQLERMIWQVSRKEKVTYDFPILNVIKAPVWDC